jgi:S-adenosylmethionine:tRNA ribosyltransferase-isomerase
MRLTDLDFILPPELIAQEPATPRDSARLFVYHRSSGAIEHHHVSDLPSLLPKHTLLVANNSKVRRSRLQASDAQGRHIEVLLLEPLSPSSYRCLLGGVRNSKDGYTFSINDNFSTPTSVVGQVVARDIHPSMTTYQVVFSSSAIANIPEFLENLAELPLPPYITQSTSAPERYQTTFAREVGSSAAPTAGLHFTPELITKLREHDMTWHEVTLHVGLGTFLPLRNEEVTANTLHFETTYISAETANAICEAKQIHKPVLAVGTTSCRTLESHCEAGIVQPGNRSTNLFIYPGYTFKAVDILFTNFHLPRSSLLLLVAAFLAREGSDPKEAIALLQHLYTIAITHRYRFYSFGDAILLLP